MAVKIRLSRVGRHKRPIYRIVVADSNAARNGKVIEILGTYDPFDSATKYNAENAISWIKRGAVATDTVRTIFNKAQLYKQVAPVPVKKEATVKVKKPASAKKSVAKAKDGVTKKAPAKKASAK